MFKNYRENTKERDPYWDNIKGLLIFLVVLGHFLWDYRNQGFARYIVEFIYFFHMPAFIFVAGYLSKSSRSRSRHSILRLIIIYFIFNTALMFFSYFIEGTSFFLITPYYSAWFLLSLIVWRWLINHLSKIPHLLLISLVVSILVGFWNDITNVLAISRTIAFFPFFAFGYHLSEETLNKSTGDRKAKDLIIGVLFLIITLILSVFFIVKYPEISDSNLLMDVYISWFDAFARLMIFSISGLMILCILLLAPKKRLPVLTSMGKNSLSIYVLHRFITLFFPKIFPPMRYEEHFVAFAFLASVITVLILGSGIVSKYLNLAVNTIMKKIFVKNNDEQILNQPGKRYPLFTLLLVAFLIIPMLANLLAPKDTKRMGEGSVDVIHPVLTTEQRGDLENALKITFVGDLILLEDQVKRAYSNTKGDYDFSSMFEYAADYLQEADLAIGVFEGPTAGEEAGYSIGNYDDGIPLYLNYPDVFAEAVKASGIDLVTTANNHLLDKGVEGAMRTLDVLDRVGLKHLGSYRNEEDKNDIVIIEEKGVRIAFLAYTFGSNYYSEEFFLVDNPNITSVIVDPKSKNFKTVRETVLSDFRRIKEMENPPDLIAVLPHMGTQFTHETDQYQDTWNGIFVEGGADIILGDHSHAVQPIEFRKAVDEDGEERTALIVNSPGNFVNSYVDHNGDATAIVEVFIDPQSKEIISSGVVPMYTQSPINGNYRALPIFNILTGESLRNEISDYEMNRITEVHEIVTSVMLDANITLDQIQDRYYLFPEGYFRQPVHPIEITDEMKDSDLYQLLEKSDRICFVGDSITAGTKNGGYGWYEPMMAAFPEKEVCRRAWGSATTITLLENADHITDQSVDLYVIAIGTNDVRYRDKKICAMDSTSYVENIDSLIASIRQKNPTAKFVLISPWHALDNDPYTAIPVEERDALLDEYSKALESYSKENGHFFVNPNPGIDEILSNEVVLKYLIDHIHPNAHKGINLYSLRVLEFSQD